MITFILALFGSDQPFFPLSRWWHPKPFIPMTREQESSRPSALYMVWDGCDGPAGLRREGFTWQELLHTSRQDGTPR